MHYIHSNRLVSLLLTEVDKFIPWINRPFIFLFEKVDSATPRIGRCLDKFPLPSSPERFDSSRVLCDIFHVDWHLVSIIVPFLVSVTVSRCMCKQAEMCDSSCGPAHTGHYLVQSFNNILYHLTFFPDACGDTPCLPMISTTTKTQFCH